MSPSSIKIYHVELVKPWLCSSLTLFLQCLLHIVPKVVRKERLTVLQI